MLIDVQKHWNHFKTWFDGLDFELTLLYRGSEQNFANASFDQLVGNQGPTLHIIKSEHDYLFGGCAFEKYPKSQSGKGDYYIPDDKSFLFQLNPNQIKLKHTLNPSYKQYGLFCYKDSLSLFGYGGAFRIYES